MLLNFLLLLFSRANGLENRAVRQFMHSRTSTSGLHLSISTESVFTTSPQLSSPDTLKMQILQLGSSLDRGQGYNPTSGDQYKESMQVVRDKVEALIQKSIPSSLTFENMQGEWELVVSTVPHGIFRSSPFFLAIQQAYADAGQADKAQLFFRLHELQTMSWGGE